MITGTIVHDGAAWALGITVLVVAVVFLIYPLGNAMLLAFVKNGEALDQALWTILIDQWREAKTIWRPRVIH